MPAKRKVVGDGDKGYQGRQKARRCQNVRAMLQLQICSGMPVFRHQGIPRPARRLDVLDYVPSVQEDNEREQDGGLIESALAAERKRRV
jgi:hypothetical protein